MEGSNAYPPFPSYFASRYEALDETDRFRVFDEYLKDLIRKDQEQKHLENEARRKLEKKARDVLLVSRDCAVAVKVSPSHYCGMTCWFPRVENIGRTHQ